MANINEEGKALEQEYQELVEQAGSDILTEEARNDARKMLESSTKRLPKSKMNSGSSPKTCKPIGCSAKHANESVY